MKTVSPLGLAISRTTTEYSFTWTDAETQFPITIQWYCLQIMPNSGVYGAACQYQGTYPASPILVPITTLLTTYGYQPGSFPTARITQKALNAGTVTYTTSNPLEEISTVDIISAPTAAVSGLAVSSSTKFNVVISWNTFSTNVVDFGNTPITGYLVERTCSTCVSGWYTLASSNAGTSLQIAVSSIESNGMTYAKTYQVRVRPINQVGQGTTPATVTLTTKAQPSAPLVTSTPVKDALSSTLLKISWPAVASDEDSTGGYPITGYQVLRAKSPVSSAASYEIVQDSLAYTFQMTSGWAWSTTYAFAIRTKNSLGTGPITSSPLLITTVKDPALCTLPTGMTTPQLVDVTPLSVSIKWSELTDETKNGGDIPNFYLVEYSPDNASWTALNTGGSMVFAFTHTVSTAFASGVNIYYRLKAKNNVGVGSPSSSLEVTSDLVPQAMNTIKSESVTPTAITLSWAALIDPVKTGGDPISFYSVEWLNPTTSLWQEMNTGQSLSLTYTHTYATPPFPGGSSQQYRVRPKNGVGLGGFYSNTLSVLCDNIPSTSPALSISQVQPRNITVKWSALTDQTQNGRDEPIFYLLEHATSAAPTTWVALNDGGALVFEFMHSLESQAIFDENLLYLYRLKAKNGVGWTTTYSATLSVTPDKRPQSMYAPYVSTGTTPSSDGQTMKWNELLDMTLNGGSIPTFYSIEHSADGVNSWATFTIDTVKTKYLTVSHCPGTILTNRAYYRVRAENEVGMSNVYSSVTTVTIASGRYRPNQVYANPTNIKISWSEQSNTWVGALPDFYQVEWLNPKIVSQTSCSGVSSAYLNDQRNPSTTSGMAWQVVSPTTGTKFTSFIHTIDAGIFPGNVFPSGSYQCYRVRWTVSGVISSTPTAKVQIQADSVPDQMPAPILVTVNPYDVTLKWEDLDQETVNGRDNTTFFLLQWYQYDEPAGWVDLTSKATTGKVLEYTHVRSGSVYSKFQQLKYRVKAENGVGEAALWSPELVLNADEEPQGMTALALNSVLPNAITISWPQLDATIDGGDTPYYFEVEHYDEPSDTWVQMIQDETIGTKLQYTHQLPADQLFAPDVKEKYRVLPKNLVGWGIKYSEELLVLTDTTPGKMNTPTSLQIDPAEIKLAWTPLTTDDETGRDPISFYTLEWYSDITDSWVELTAKAQGLVTQFTFTPASLDPVFPPNTVYEFRAIAQNTLGYGTYSDTLSITTDNVPQRMNIPTATLISPKQVDLKWIAITADADTGRDAIRYYKVEMLERPCYLTTADCMAEDMALGAWVEVTDEATQGTLLTFQHKVSLILKPAEYYFYRVCPKNRVGFGVCSEEYSFMSDTTPKFMYPPQVLSDNITPTTIKITWSSILYDSQTGGDPASFYDLQWDEGSGQTTWTSLISEASGMVNTYTHTATTLFPNGQKLYYKLRGKNGVGYGVFSTITEVLTDATPGMMNAPVVSTADITPTSMKVTWASITDCTLSGRDCPTYYGLEWDQGLNTWTNLTTTSMGMINSYTVNFPVFPSGTSIKFRTYARNRVGYGEYSTTVTAISDKYPQYMNTPVATQVTPSSITLTWTQLTLSSQTGGNAVTYYELEWEETTGVWVALTSQATDGKVLTKTHTLSAGQIFPSGSTIKYRARGMNGVGFGVYSATCSVQADSVPLFMNAPNDVLQTDITPYSIKVTWSGITLDTDTGRDPVTYYELSWYDSQTSLWEVLNPPTDPPTLQYSFTLTRASIFPSGTNQRFKLRAKNGVGYGAYSAEKVALADSVPLFMNAPDAVIAADITPNRMRLTWTGISLDAQTGRDPVTYYELQWYNYETLIWDVLTSPTQTPLLQTSFTFTRATNFPSGSSQKFRLRAQNGVGLGAFSAETIVVADSVPTFMNPLNNVLIDAKTPKSMSVSWNTITSSADTGGDPVTYYELQWYNYETQVWDVLTSPTQTPLLQTAFIFTRATIFPSGSTQRFRLRAQNGVGLGAYSVESVLIADSVPEFMNAPSVALPSDITPKSIKLYWNPITSNAHTGRDPVIYYELQWLNYQTEQWEVLTSPTQAPLLQTSFTFAREVIFPSGSTQQFRVRAQNGVGLGAFSATTVVVADSVPTFMYPPKPVPLADVAPKSMRVTWDSISTDAQTGRDPVTYYELQWYSEVIEDWEVLTVPSETVKNEFTFTRETVFPSGSNQRFRIRAQNGVGFGALSDETVVIADSVTTFMNTGTAAAAEVLPKSMKITWNGITSVEDTGGDPVIYYELQWANYETELWETLTTPTTSPAYQFTLTRSVIFPSASSQRFRLRGMNGVGYGAYSDDFFVTADSVPTFAYQPTNTSVSPTTMTFTWEGISTFEHTGGDPAIYYEMECDQGTDEWIVITSEAAQGIGLSLTYTPAQKFLDNQIIRYRLRAKNGVGLGAYSDVLELLSDGSPVFMNLPAIDYSGDDIKPGSIRVTWNDLLDYELTGRDLVTYYQLEWHDTLVDQWIVLTQNTGLLMNEHTYTLPDGQVFPSGSSQSFRVRAQNGVGLGVPSAVLTVDADSIPLFMNIPQVYYLGNKINPTWIELTWLGISDWPQTGGDDVVYYELSWDQGSDGTTWTVLTTEDNGLQNSFRHTIPAPFPSGSLQKYRLRAKNGVGIGAYSEILTVEADKVPQFMNTPQVDMPADKIKPLSIEMTWTGISDWADTGGDDVVYYEVQWDQGSGGQSWAVISSQADSLKYSIIHQVSTPFPSGSPQQYRIRGKNGVGLGLFSVPLVVQADKIPQFMPIPQVDYLANDINPHSIKVTWGTISAWTDTGGDAADYYGLEWDQTTGHWTSLTTPSMGLTNLFTLQSPGQPFASGCAIKFRVQARNGVGYGLYSEVLTIQADSIPLRMNPPIEVEVKYNEISMRWDPISDWADTGGDDIIYYKVEFLKKPCYDGDSTDCTGQVGTWVELTDFDTQGVLTTFTHAIPADQHFSRDKLFDYRICAQNGVGMGACSPVTQILTDTIPLKMDALTFVEVFHDQTLVKWNKVETDPASGRSPVTKYRIQWDNYMYFNDPKYFPDHPELVPWVLISTVPFDQTPTPDDPNSITFIHEIQPNFISRRKIMYRIQAINNVGEGSWSEPLMVKTVDRIWSKARSWGTRGIPLAGQDLIVPSGQNWTFDLVESPIYKNVEVNGRLQFREEAAQLHLRANNLIVKTGHLIIGTEKDPFLGVAQITLAGGKNAPGYSNFDGVLAGNKLFLNFGLVQMNGKPRKVQGRLLDSVNEGDLTLKLTPGLGWAAGDRIALAPTNMRYKQNDYAVIVSYNNVNGLTTVDRALQHYHYGSINSTSKAYSGVDMRGHVYLLSRNIQIQGQDLDNWGCQILTSSREVSPGVRVRGQTFLDNVEISHCSQYGSLKAALRFEDTGGLPSNITNSALHHGDGVAVQIDNADRVTFVNNTIYSHAKYGFNISTSNQILIQRNLVSNIQERFLNEAAPTKDNDKIDPSAGIVGCVHSDCMNLRILDNHVSGTGYAGYVVPGHDCGESESQQTFRGNTANSIKGWGAIVFVNQKSFSQKTLCMEASYFTAYKCIEGGIMTYNGTLASTFSYMTLIDNHIGGTIMIGDEKNENDTAVASFRNSVFYGETDARDCPSHDSCSHQQNSGSEACVSRIGLMSSYFTKMGKVPLVQRERDLPMQRVLSDAAYGGEAVYRNLSFINFSKEYTWCAVTQKAVALNNFGSDYHPRGKFFGTTFVNQHEDALVDLFTPPIDWVDIRKCGKVQCSGPENTYIHFENTVVNGFKSQEAGKKLPSKFQVVPYIGEGITKLPGCNFVKSWNAYQCINPNLGILLFESRDDDKKTRPLAPITVTQREINYQKRLNQFQSHQETFQSEIERLSRYPALIMTGSPKPYRYYIDYGGLEIPQRQRFTLVADTGSVIINIKYSKGGAYILRDRQNKQFPMSPYDDKRRQAAAINGTGCGENSYDPVEKVLEFYLTPNCSLWIEAVDIIEANLRLNQTLETFNSNGGVKTFKRDLAEQLDVKETFITVMNVRRGSVIIDFQILPAEEDATLVKKGGLNTIKKDLNYKIENQKIWLGAPIMNATVKGQSVAKTSEITNVFEDSYKWEATGSEVWVIPPRKQVPQQQVIVVSNNGTITEITIGDLGKTSTLAIIIGVLLAVGVLVCCVAFFVYRKYREKHQEEDINRVQAEIEKQQKKVDQSCESPLKSHHDDVTLHNNEDEEQFHPTQNMSLSYIYEGDYGTNRKANEFDGLMNSPGGPRDLPPRPKSQPRHQTLPLEEEKDNEIHPTFGLHDHIQFSERSIHQSMQQDDEPDDKAIGDITYHYEDDDPPAGPATERPLANVFILKPEAVVPHNNYFIDERPSTAHLKEEEATGLDEPIGQLDSEPEEQAITMQDHHVKGQKMRQAEMGDAESDNQGIPEILFDEKEDQLPALGHVSKEDTLKSSPAKGAGKGDLEIEEFDDLEVIEQQEEEEKQLSEKDEEVFQFVAIEDEPGTQELQDQPDLIQAKEEEEETYSLKMISDDEENQSE